MFGVVPRQLWARLNPPDDQNMCTWAMRCLLIESGARKILIDTGMGDKQDERFRSHFQPHDGEGVVAALAQSGVKAEEITDVLITHFHFDHVGGAVIADPDGTLRPAFPNAKYWTNDAHYKWAIQPNYREKASFLKENFVPLKEQGALEFLEVEQDMEWIEGIRLKFMFGHTEAMIVPIIPLPGGRKLAYMADLLPSTAHIRMPYVMSYDIRPLETLKEKQLFFEEATDKNYYLFLEHDPFHEICNLRQNEKGLFELNETYQTKDLLAG